MKRWAVVLVLVAAMAGCDSTPSADNPIWRGPTVSTPTHSLRAESVPAGPSGILTTSLGSDRWANTTKLTIHDINTGRPLFTATMPGWHGRVKLRRQSFSPDRSLLVWGDDDCRIFLAKKAAGGNYQRVGEWRPPQRTPGHEQLCYGVPLFKDGRVWARVSRENGEPAIVSFDPAAPGSPPRTEQEHADGLTLDSEGRPANEIDVTLSGAEGSSGSLLASDRALVSAQVRHTTDTTTTSVFYVCNEAVDEQTLLCVAQGGGQVYGALALLTADRAAKTVTLRQVSAKIEGGIRGAYLAPDRKKAAIHTDGGWYLADLAGGAAPRLLFPQLATNPAEVQFWA